MNLLAIFPFLNFQNRLNTFWVIFTNVDGVGAKCWLFGVFLYIKYSKYIKLDGGLGLKLLNARMRAYNISNTDMSMLVNNKTTGYSNFNCQYLQKYDFCIKILIKLGLKNKGVGLK